MKIIIEKAQYTVAGKDTKTDDGKIYIHTYMEAIINRKANMEDETTQRITKTGTLFNVMKAQFFGKKNYRKLQK